MGLLSRSYQLINTLSIDVALGAVICSRFFAKAFETDVDNTVFVCLGLSVWLIYTFDHLRDTRAIGDESSSQRRAIHREYFTVLLILAFLVGCLLVVLLLRVNYMILTWGIGLSIFVLIYFAFNRILNFAKEFLGAVLYTLGVLLPALSTHARPWGILSAPPVILFFTIALINLVLFSLFDEQRDRTDGQPSIVATLGAAIVRKVLNILFTVGAVLLVITAVEGWNWFELSVFGTMCLVLYIIFLFSDWFAVEDRYRLAGDAIFLTPLLYLV